MRASLERGRLAAWVALVGVMTLLGYGSRAAGGKPPKDAAYQYSTGVSGLLQYAVILGVVLAIARPDWRLLALRRPTSYRPVLTTALARLRRRLRRRPDRLRIQQPRAGAGADAGPLGLAACASLRVQLRDLRRRRARGRGAHVPRARLLAARAPRPDRGRPLVGLSFGLAHGLIEGLPILIVFGAGLALLRARTDSVYPGMVVHALFNAIALILSVTI